MNAWRHIGPTAAQAEKVLTGKKPCMSQAEI
jgi:hypothetical protein